jgi:hypothetical protein
LAAIDHQRLRDRARLVEDISPVPVELVERIVMPAWLPPVLPERVEHHELVELGAPPPAHR